MVIDIRPLESRTECDIIIIPIKISGAFVTSITARCKLNVSIHVMPSVLINNVTIIRFI